MINISKSGNAIKFAFTDSDHYLYGNGEIEVPVNSLSLIVDESNMVTFRKANSNDIFLSFNPANSNLSDKAGVIDFYKTNMVGSTGGGGSESGITSGEVQTMIDNSLEDYYDKDEVDSGFSTVNTAIAGKADTSAVTAVANDVSTLSGQVATKVATSDFSAYSAATDARIAEDEEVTAAALNDLQENKADTSSVTAAIDAAISGKADTSAVTAVNDALTAHTSDTGIHVSAQEKNAWNAKAEPYSAGTGIDITDNVISATGGSSVTVDSTLDSGSTNPVANSAITAGINDAKAYYISFATIAQNGIHDADWDGIVAAIDDHRPIYAGYPRQDGGIIYYGVECMNKNVGNTEIVMTTSDNSQHYFYTFTKNGSNDYSFTSETRPYVTDAEKTAWNAKAEPYSAGTGIEISGNVISATGGGGATYSAGTNISIDTANTINCTLPISKTGDDSVVIGKGNYMSIGSNVQSSVIAGNSVTAATGSHYSLAVGNNLHISNPQETSTGSWNKTSNSSGTFGNSGNTLVSFGNGRNQNSMHNAFEIRQNGDIYFPDTDNTTYAQYYQKPMVRLQDMYGALGGLKLVKLTQSEYDQLATKDPDTLYIITNVVS